MVKTIIGSYRSSDAITKRSERFVLLRKQSHVSNAGFGVRTAR